MKRREIEDRLDAIAGAAEEAADASERAGRQLVAGQRIGGAA